MAEQPPHAMTVRDVAGFLAVAEKTIYRLAQQGELPGFKTAGTWRFQLQDIQGWIDEQKKQAVKVRGPRGVGASRTAPG